MRLRGAGRAGVALGLLALALPGSASGAAVAYQADAAHSGFVANGLNPPLGRKWIRRDLGFQVSYPVVAEGKVFVTAYAGSSTSSGYGSSIGPTFLHALDRNSGTTIWSRQVATGGLPAYGDGRVYVLGTEALDAVSAATGERVWRAEMRGAHGVAPVADGPFVYASDGRGAHAVSADTGLIVQTESLAGSGFTVVGDRVYVVKGGCNEIALYTRGLAQQVWTRNGPCSSSATGVPGAYHSLGTTPPNERIWARDPNGQTGLVVDALTSLGTEQFTSAGGLALAGEHAFLRQAGAVEARSQASGVTTWRATPASQLRGGLLAVRDFVWVTTGTGELVALRRGDGAALFRVPLIAGDLEAADHDTGASPAHAGMAADENGLLVPYANRLVALGAGADSPGVDDPDKIPAGNTKLSAALSPRDLEFGTKAKVSGEVSDQKPDSSFSSDALHDLELQADPYPYDNAWTTVDRARTRSTNSYELDNRPDRNTRYRVVDTSTAPAVISKTFQAWVYARIRLGLGFRGTGRVRVSASVSGPDQLKLNGKRVYVYRLRSRRGGGVRIGSIKLKRVRGTSYRAAGTVRVPGHRPRTDYFLICVKYPDTRAWTRLNGRKDPCGGRRV